MYISKEKCTGCKMCVSYCPVGAIEMVNPDAGRRHAVIDRDGCVECSVCHRANVCKFDAIVLDELDWPRNLRRFFSDPFSPHKGTNVPGRGTEEMKTNDLTMRFPEGYIGIGLEFGRPGVGVYLSDTEKALKKFISMGIDIEPCNPLTQLIKHPSTGELDPDVKSEKVLSAIVEFIIPAERLDEVILAIKELEQDIQTVFSLDIIQKVPKDGMITLRQDLLNLGIECSFNGKVNVGLGREGV